jgi:hypothetical protein
MKDLKERKKKRGEGVEEDRTPEFSYTVMTGEVLRNASSLGNFHLV